MLRGVYCLIIWEGNILYKTVIYYIGNLHVEGLMELFGVEYIACRIVH